MMIVLYVKNADQMEELGIGKVKKFVTVVGTSFTMSMFQNN